MRSSRSRRDRSSARRTRAMRGAHAALAVALGALGAIAAGCGAPANADRSSPSEVGAGQTSLGQPMWETQLADTSGGFIGLFVVDSSTVWAAGRGGRVAHTRDGGATWSVDAVPGAEALQFRDVHAFSATEAWVLSIGAGGDSGIWSTRDGGSTWTSSFRNEDPDAFYDCFSFWDRDRALALSDSHDGEFKLLSTMDGGKTWHRLDPATLPAARPREGAFASSGTCVVTRPGGLGWFVTGSSGVDTRVMRTSDYGAHWAEAVTPIASPNGTSGIFSLAFLDDTLGVVVGGDLSAADAQTDDVALTTDGGATWRVGGPTGLGGAVYGVSWVPGAPTPTMMAVSPAGSVLSRDGGESWARVDSVNAWAVDFRSADAGWSVGPAGIRRTQWR